jgi:hypothetical protein
MNLPKTIFHSRFSNGGCDMRKNTCTKLLLAVCTVLLLAAVPLGAQGISRQDYSGLDKYLDQGRMSNSTFVGTRAAEFLTIPVGARGIGMGNAYAAVVDDITSTWWNPAGLGFLTQKEVTLTVVDYTLDLTYSYGAAAFPIGDGNVVLGGFFGYLDIPEMEVTTVGSPQGTGTFFRAYDFQMGGTAAYNFSDRFVSGISLKYIHQDMWSNLGASAFAMDVGAVYHTELYEREIRFAFTIQNLGTNMTMSGPNLVEEVGAEDRGGGFPTDTENYNLDPNAISRRSTRALMIRTHTYRLPTTVKISLGYNLYTSQNVNWMAVGEIARPSYIPIAYSAGSELSYNFNHAYSASLRAGWMFQTDEYTDSNDQFGYEYYGDDPTFRGFSVGGGIQRSFGGRLFRFDYAYRNKGRLSADNFFTVSLGF